MPPFSPPLNYANWSAFLICGGPSLLTHDLTLLKQRGILTLAVNNAATVVQPNLWVHVDDPSRFADAIWRDPSIIKFTPRKFLGHKLRVRNAADKLVWTDHQVQQMPAVIPYDRNDRFQAATFLSEETFNWGNGKARVDDDRHKGSRSVMYVAIKLLYRMGIRVIYLLGCDFRMAEAGADGLGAQNYAFTQGRKPGAVRGNNRSYQVMNARFARLLPYFNAAGLHIRNCTVNSGLTVFPYIGYNEALSAALAGFPTTINTAGMYDS